MLREAWLLGYLSAEDYQRLQYVAPIRVAKDMTEEDLCGRALAYKEIRAVLAACQADHSLSGVRDAAMIAYGLGMRSIEISRARLADYDSQRGLLYIPWGKGNKSRTVPVEGRVKKFLEARLYLRGDVPGLLFFGLNKRQRVQSLTLKSYLANKLYRRRAAQAGIVITSFHDLRRTFISNLLEQGVDMRSWSLNSPDTRPPLLLLVMIGGR